MTRVSHTQIKEWRDETDLAIARSIIDGLWGKSPGRGRRKWAKAILAKTKAVRPAVLEHEEI